MLIVREIYSLNFSELLVEFHPFA